MNPTELRVLRRNTKAFINESPAEVVLVPVSRTADGAGGYKTTSGTARDPQTMRMIPLASTAAMGELQTPDGRNIRPRYILMAEWDAIIERWDTFTWEGEQWLVGRVQEKHEYQTKAEIVPLGSA